jgi:hypothetical protein
MLKLVRETAPFLVAACALTIGFSLYYVRFSGTDNLIVLHFGAGRGADAIGEANTILGMLGVGTAITIVNLALKTALWRKNRGLADATGYVAATASLLILIAILGIISVN